MARVGGWKYCKAIGYSRNQIESVKKAPFASILTFANSHAEAGPHNCRAQSRARFGNALSPILARPVVHSFPRAFWLPLSHSQTHRAPTANRPLSLYALARLQTLDATCS